MHKYLLSILLLVSNIAHSATIVETRTIETVLPHIDEESWFLVDLDNTVYQAKQALGHVNWLQHEVQSLVEAGMSKEDAFHSLYPLWKKTQMVTEVVPVEAQMIEAILDLQKRNIVVMGVTHRQPFIVSETLRQLSSIGVDLKLSAPHHETLHIPSARPALYTQGILFVNDFNSKGDIFRALLQQFGRKPKKIVFIDDKKKNVEELAKAAEAEGIAFIGIHYTAVEHGPQIYSPELAAIQLKFFNQIINNQHALQLIDTMEEFQMEPQFLYKVVSYKAWQESLKLNLVVGSDIDRDFIHLAKEDELDHVVQKFWKGQDYILLKLSTHRLSGRLVYETNPGGTTKYYHLYEGMIPLEAVVEVTSHKGV